MTFLENIFSENVMDFWAYDYYNQSVYLNRKEEYKMADYNLEYEEVVKKIYASVDMDDVY